MANYKLKRNFKISYLKSVKIFMFSKKIKISNHYNTLHNNNPLPLKKHLFFSQKKNENEFKSQFSILELRTLGNVSW